MARTFEAPTPFEIIPEGTYRVELIDIDDTLTKTQRVQWKFTFEVIGYGREDGTPFLLFARTWPNMNGFLDTFDPDRLWMQPLCLDPNFDVDSLIGQQFMADVIHTEYNGKAYANIHRLGDTKTALQKPAAASAGDVEPGSLGDPFADQ